MFIFLDKILIAVIALLRDIIVSIISIDILIEGSFLTRRCDIAVYFILICRELLKKNLMDVIKIILGISTNRYGIRFCEYK